MHPVALNIIKLSVEQDQIYLPPHFDMTSFPFILLKVNTPEDTHLRFEVCDVKNKKPLE